MNEKRKYNRFEEDGLYVSSLEHWELIEDIVFHRYYCKPNNYELGRFHIPIAIVRHLGLEDKEIIDIAIRRHKK